MSPSTLEEEIRAAAMVHVRSLSDMHARRIPRQALMEGLMFRGERVPLWNYQKGIYKPAAFGRDGAALSVQTSLDGPYADVHDETAGRITYKYRGDNREHPDNVALRRAYELQRPIIYFVAVDPGVYDAILPVYVAGDDPAGLQFTLTADQLGVATQIADPVMTAARREYATRAVLQRLHQQQFRRMVLAAYQERCSICRLTYKELLDAAHILPDRHVLGEPVVPNGLGLCKIHHSAYDANIIGIDPEAMVHVREDVLHEIDGPMLKHGLQEISGTTLFLPKHSADRPNPDFLAERFDRFRAA